MEQIPAAGSLVQVVYVLRNKEQLPSPLLLKLSESDVSSVRPDGIGQ
jgi:hypothetical protein